MPEFGHGTTRQRCGTVGLSSISATTNRHVQSCLGDRLLRTDHVRGRQSVQHVCNPGGTNGLLRSVESLSDDLLADSRHVVSSSRFQWHAGLLDCSMADTAGSRRLVHAHLDADHEYRGAGLRCPVYQLLRPYHQLLRRAGCAAFALRRVPVAPRRVPVALRRPTVARHPPPVAVPPWRPLGKP